MASQPQNINMMNEGTLYMMYDDEVVTATKNYISNLVQSAGSVHGTFYDSVGINSSIPNSSPSLVTELSTALIACSIGNASSFKFNNCVSLSSATNDLANSLNSKDTASLGGSIYTWCFPDNCKSPDKHIKFSQYLAAKSEWGPKFKKYLTNPTVINGIMTEFGVENGKWESYINLALFKLVQLTDLSTANEVKDVWKDVYPDLNLDPSLVFLNSTLYSTTWALNAVNAAIGKSSSYTPPCYSMGCIPITTTTYGKAVVNWVKKTKYWTGKYPKNSKTDNPYSCFTPNTKIQLSKQRTVSISTVKEGMSVLGANGFYSKTTDEKVEITLSEETPIYGFNDDEPFFIASHAFYTQDRGWCSLDPVKTNEENPNIKCNKLREGDIVLKLKNINGNGKINYEYIKIYRFSSKTLPPKSNVYGLHLVNGPHSYHANGYLVAMNYPMITKGRISKAVKTKLSIKERHELKSKLQSVAPLLEKSMGKGITKHLFESFVTDIEEKKMEKKKMAFNSSKISHIHNSYGIDVRHVKHLHFDIADSKNDEFDGDEKKFVDSIDDEKIQQKSYNKVSLKSAGKELVHGISLDRGDLYINNQKINRENVKFVTNKEINFKHNDGSMHGHLRFSHDYNVIHGNIWGASRANEATACQIFTAALPPTKYSTQISSTSYKDADSANNATDSKMNTSVDILYGYEIINGIVERTLQIGGAKIFIQNDAISIDKSGLATVTVTFNINNDDVVNAASNDSNYPVACEWTFKYDFSSFVGAANTAIYKTIGDKNFVQGVDTTKYFRFTGATVENSNSYKDYARERIAKNRIMKSRKPINILKAMAMLAENDDMKTETTAQQNNNSMADLMSTPLDGVVDETNENIMRNMKYQMGTDGGEWLDDFFGEITPALTAKQKQLVNEKDGASFYQNFYKGYLGYNLNEATKKKGGFSDKLPNQEVLQLKSFLEGGLCQVDGYHVQSNGLYVEALLEKQPKLSNYLNDKTTDWCHELYKTVSSNTFLCGMVAEWSIDPNGVSSQAQRYGTLINTLGYQQSWTDPETGKSVPDKGAYLCGEFYSAWLICTLQNQITGSTLNVGGKDNDDPNGMSDYFRDVIDTIVNKAKFDKLDPKIQNQLIDQKVQEAFIAMEVQVGSSVELANDILNIFRSVSSIPGMKQKMEAIQESMKNKFGESYAKIGAVCSFLMAVGSIVSVALQWKTMNDSERAASVLQSLSLVGQSVGDLTKAFGTEGSAFYEMMVGDGMKAWMKDSLTDMSASMGESEYSWISRMGESLGDAMQNEESWVNKAIGNLFEEGLAGAFTKICGIAANIAACVVAWIDVAEVFKKGSGATALTKALTVCQAVIQTAIVVVEFVALVVESTFLACAGPLLALAGVIIAIILMFTTKKHPKSPADKFKDQVFTSWWNENKDKDWFKL